MSTAQKTFKQCYLERVLRKQKQKLRVISILKRARSLSFQYLRNSEVTIPLPSSFPPNQNTHFSSSCRTNNGCDMNDGFNEQKIRFQENEGENRQSSKVETTNTNKKRKKRKKRKKQRTQNMSLLTSNIDFKDETNSTSNFSQLDFSSSSVNDTTSDVNECKDLKKKEEENGVICNKKNEEGVDYDYYYKYWNVRYHLFSRFDEGILLDWEGWYSVTPELIAKQTANRCKCDVIIDAFCGAGGNSIQFALSSHRVIAIDINEQRLNIARHNAKIYNVDHKIEFIVADYLTIAPTLKADVVFLSPPWGGPSYSSVPSLDLNTFNGKHIYEVSAKITPNIAYFLPRNINTEQVLNLSSPLPCEIEPNYLFKRLKGVTAYFGDLAFNSSPSPSASPSSHSNNKKRKRKSKRAKKKKQLKLSNNNYDDDYGGEDGGSYIEDQLSEGGSYYEDNSYYDEWSYEGEYAEGGEYYTTEEYYNSQQWYYDENYNNYYVNDEQNNVNTEEEKHIANSNNIIQNKSVDDDDDDDDDGDDDDEH